MKKTDNRPQVLASALAVALGSSFVPAQAATYEVDSLGSTVNAADGVTTLREAIQKANASAGTDIITFNSELSGTIFVGGAGQLPVLKQSTILLGNGNITLDAQGAPYALRAGKYEVYDEEAEKYYPAGGNTNVTISGLRITGASNVAVISANKYNGSLNIQDSVITGNNAAVSSSGKYQTLSISGSQITNNASSSDGKYGAINHYSYVGGVQIVNSTISGNSGPSHAVMSYVEAGYSEGPGSIFAGVSISDSTISNNSGGVYANGGSTEIVDTVISGNNALYSEGLPLARLGSGSQGNGGGLFLYNTYATISGGSIKNNTAYDEGGGIYASESALTLNNVTVSGNTAQNGDGGGIHFARPNNDCCPGIPFNLTLQGSTISGNKADNDGGGVYFDGSEGYSSNEAYLRILGTRITGNSITGGGTGGGLDVRFDASNFEESGIEITGSQILNNEALYGDGGGANIDVRYTNFTIASSIVDGNSTVGSSSDGGGLRLELYRSDVEIERSTISGNASDGTGGGIDVYAYDSSLTIAESLVKDNTAVGDGGGIASDSYYSEDSLVIENSLLTGNVSQSMGGAIAAYDRSYSSSLQARLTNSTITGNSAVGGAGAILASMAYGSYEGTNVSITLTGVTITDNPTTGTNESSVERAQIFVGDTYYADVNLDHSVVSGNAPDADIGIDNYYSAVDTVITAVYSLVGSQLVTSEGGSVSFDEGSTALLGDDPMLDVLASNGGFTQTMLPLPGSPLINGGSASNVADLNGEDQRGSPRLDGGGLPIGDAIDIGAVELLDDNNDGMVDDLSPVVTSGLIGALGGVVGKTVNVNVLDYVTDPEGYTFTGSDIQFEGLPPGISYNPGTGILSGTLQVAGQYIVTASADDTTSAPTVVQRTVTIQTAEAAAASGGGGSDGGIGGFTPGWLLMLAGLLGLGRRRR